MFYGMAENPSYKRNSQTAGRVIEGQAFVITADDNKLHRLNVQATVLWDLSAQSPVTSASAADALCKQFEVEHEQALNDARLCLENFVARKIFVAE